MWPPSKVDVVPAQTVLSAGTHADPVGTRDPLRLIGADPGGRWVAICQARRDTDGDGRTHVSFGDHGERFGDAWRPYLVWQGGHGTAVDDVVGSDDSGDKVAFVLDGQLMLLDAEEGTVSTIDPNFDARSGRPRTVSFDARGEAMAFIHGRELWLHRPTSKTNRRVEVGARPVRQVALSPSGRSAVTMIPAARSTDRCRAPASAWRDQAPVRSRRGAQVVDLETSARRRLPRRVGWQWTGEALVLERGRDVPLVLDGQRRSVRPFEACDEPWLWSADPRRARVVVRCETTVEWTPSGTRVLDDYAPDPAVTRWIGAPTRTFTTVREYPLPATFGDYPKWKVVARDAAHAVLVEPTGGSADAGLAVVWIDLASGASRSLGRFVDGRHPKVRGHHMAMGNDVFDLRIGRRVLEIEDHSFEFLGDDARVLIRERRGSGSREVPPGPLRWAAQPSSRPRFAPDLAD